MLTEQKIRKYIKKILLEEAEVTSRPGRGGYKKEIRDAGALAKTNPTELMRRLKITPVNDDSDIKRLNSVLVQATSGTDAMGAVYGDPSPRKDNSTGLEGIRVPVKIITPRDARKYLEHTVSGAQAARYSVFDKVIQVEILGNDILVYFSDRPYSWGVKAAVRRKKKPAQDPRPTSQEETAGIEETEIIGEPDVSPDRSTPKKEISLAGVSGVMTPLGTGPSYPNKEPNARKTPAQVAGAAFGGAKLAKRKK